MRYFIVDAFTNRAFAGNPAAVVMLDRSKSDEWLQNVAKEMNLSATAFVFPNGNQYDLRWFTSKAELDLCGHATLASAFVLAELGKLPTGLSVSFSTHSGILKAERQDALIRLDFPLLAVQPFDAPPSLLQSLNVQPRYVGRSKLDFLIEVESESALRRIKPDFKAIARVDCRGVVVTAASDDPRFDFASRFFAPTVGIDEDPVTGSAHCLLAPYWGARLGKSKMTAYQASARGGVIHVETRGERVILGGEAIIFATGEIAVGVEQ